MKETIKNTSKFLSYVLRHNPAEIDLQLDENGWASIEQLINNANARGRQISLELIKNVVMTSDKQRFAISGDGLSIRANQGHSIGVDLALESKLPPNTLLHGTAERNLEAILERGLLKMNRHHVHLSESRSTASAVGQRYGKLVLLEVNAIEMFNDGYQFSKSENNVWLVDSVPARYIQVIK